MTKEICETCADGAVCYFCDDSTVCADCCECGLTYNDFTVSGVQVSLVLDHATFSAVRELLESRGYSSAIRSVIDVEICEGCYEPNCGGDCV